MNRHTRYQGAIIRDRRVLLIKHREHATGRSYWLFPGGGIEPYETEEECVKREMKEETGLDVTVEGLLLEEPDTAPGTPYATLRTYLCESLSGDARPGYEPEPGASAVYGIVQVGWFDLASEASWDPAAVNDPITYPRLQSLRKKLGYLVE